MRVVITASKMSKISDEVRRNGKRIVFVPTMGALHGGHLALIREGRQRGDLVVVSLFVNPTQFNDPKDFEKYPRDLEADLKKCRAGSVDLVFAPSVEEIYPPSQSIPEIPVPAVAKPLEGKSRPGHFKGVVNVVWRLFQIVKPDAAVFGLKDYQQLRVIQEMVREQSLPIEIIPHPIVRSPEGLALSSRNERLSPNGRTGATILSRALKRGEEAFRQGEREARRIQEIVSHEIAKDPEIRIDYVEVVDAESLLTIDRIEQPALAAIATFVEGIRLIDNCILEPGRAKSIF